MTISVFVIKNIKSIQAHKNYSLRPQLSIEKNVINV